MLLYNNKIIFVTYLVCLPKKKKKKTHLIITVWWDFIRDRRRRRLCTIFSGYQYYLSDCCCAQVYFYSYIESQDFISPSYTPILNASSSRELFQLYVLFVLEINQPFIRTLLIIILYYRYLNVCGLCVFRSCKVYTIYYFFINTIM